jgi:hypothetical protein
LTSKEIFARFVEPHLSESMVGYLFFIEGSELRCYSIFWELVTQKTVGFPPFAEKRGKGGKPISQHTY